MGEITIEQYNELKKSYDDLVIERDALKSSSDELAQKVKAQDDKIKNLNEMLYDHLITDKKAEDVSPSPEIKSFSDMYRETLINMQKRS